MSEVSTKPYLLRAIHEWCVDQGLTPYVAVRVDARARVPANAVSDNQIVLNLSPGATERLQMGNELITCQARFGGVPYPLSIPVENVLAIYARENGQGMAFEVARPEGGEAGGPGEAGRTEDGSAAGEEAGSEQPGATEASASDDSGKPGKGGPPDDGTPPPSPGGGRRPRLKVVK